MAAVTLRQLPGEGGAEHVEGLADGLLFLQPQHALCQVVDSKAAAVHINAQNTGLQRAHQDVQIGLRLQVGPPQGCQALPLMRQGFGIAAEFRTFWEPGEAQFQRDLQQGIRSKDPGPQIDHLQHRGRHIPGLTGRDGQRYIRRIAGAGVDRDEFDLRDAQIVQLRNALVCHLDAQIHQHGLRAPGELPQSVDLLFEKCQRRRHDVFLVRDQGGDLSKSVGRGSGNDIQIGVSRHPGKIAGFYAEGLQRDAGAEKLVEPLSIGRAGGCGLRDQNDGFGHDISTSCCFAEIPNSAQSP